jgi:hypothetical protein
LAREAKRKFSYVAVAHARSPTSPTSYGVDFSLSGAAHLHAGRRLSLPRPIASGLTLEMDRYTAIDDCSHCKIPSLNAWFSTSQARSRLLRTLLSETPLLLVNKAGAPRWHVRNRALACVVRIARFMGDHVTLCSDCKTFSQPREIPQPTYQPNRTTLRQFFLKH